MPNNGGDKHARIKRGFKNWKVGENGSAMFRRAPGVSYLRAFQDGGRQQEEFSFNYVFLNYV